MRVVIFICVLIGCQHSNLRGQSIAKDIKRIAPDSCFVTISKVLTKEMTKPFQEPFERELARVLVTVDDMDMLLRKASKKSSYQDSRALLTHSNVLFTFYKNGAVCSTLRFSTVTGNIAVSNSNTGNEFYSNASGKIRPYLVNLLKKYGVLKMIDSIDRQAIEQN